MLKDTAQGPRNLGAMRMTEQKVVSAYSQYLESVQDMLLNVDLDQHFEASSLTQVAITFGHYTEESRLLFPTLFLTNNYGLLARRVQAKALIKIWEGKKADLNLLQLVKTGAPLAENGWSLVCGPADQEQYFFGLFRPRAVPTEAAAELTMLDNGGEPAKTIVLRNAGSRTTRLLSSTGRELVLDSRPSAGSMQRERDVIQRFVEKCTSGIELQNRAITANCLSAAMDEALRSDHGFLVILVDNGAALPDIFNDFARLDPPIEYQQLALRLSHVNHYDEFAIASGELSLLSSMLWSDGAVVLNARATVVAFNAFAKVVGAESRVKRIRHAGGARKRAFEAVKTNPNSEFRGALLRSSDGGMDFWVP